MKTQNKQENKNIDKLNKIGELTYKINKLAKAYGRKGIDTIKRPYIIEKQRFFYELKEQLLKKFGVLKDLHTINTTLFKYYTIGTFGFHQFPTDEEEIEFFLKENPDIAKEYKLEFVYYDYRELFVYPRDKKKRLDKNGKYIPITDEEERNVVRKYREWKNSKSINWEDKNREAIYDITEDEEEKLIKVAQKILKK